MDPVTNAGAEPQNPLSDTRTERLSNRSSRKSIHLSPPDHPTSYLETMMHLLRGNLGSGLFAMGDAFRNGGMIFSTASTLFLAVLCVHNQHVLLKCSGRVKEKFGLVEDPDFAETVEMCFEVGAKRLRSWSKVAKYIVNTFICVTQIGFCCVYFVFASTTLNQVMVYYDVHVHYIVPLLIVAVPILLPSLLTNLKYLAPFSMFANVCMLVGIVVVFYYAIKQLPPFSDRDYIGELANLPLYFGTAMFAFEGIALVLPLKNSMRHPEKFKKPLGVLNVGMSIATSLYTSFGFFGYWRWGDKVEGSLTLNLPQEILVAQIVKLAVALGMCVTFSLQFFIPMQIMLPSVQRRFMSRCHPVLIEQAFRIFMVALAFSVAALVPHLNVIISLIGAMCATFLAMLLPVLCQLVLAYGADLDLRPSCFLWCKNLFIILFSIFGLMTGTYESMDAMVKAFQGHKRNGKADPPLS